MTHHAFSSVAPYVVVTATVWGMAEAAQRAIGLYCQAVDVSGAPEKAAELMVAYPVYRCLAWLLTSMHPPAQTGET